MPKMTNRILSLSMQNNKWGWAAPGPYGRNETFDLAGLWAWLTDSLHLTPSHYTDKCITRFINGRIVTIPPIDWKAILDEEDGFDDWDVDWRER